MNSTLKVMLICIGVALLLFLGWFMWKNNLGTQTESQSTTDNNQPVAEKEVMGDEDVEQDKEEILNYREYTFEDLARTDPQSNAVLFFYAPWCPTCQYLDKKLSENIRDFPDDLIVFKTDYDKELELKKKYGVTYQHTLVHVDNTGKMIKKWSGSYTLEEIINELGM